MSKYFTPQKIHQIVADTEKELEAREQAEFEAMRLAKIDAFVRDPKNA